VKSFKMLIIMLLSILMVLPLLSGCSPLPSENNFAIYLTGNAMPFPSEATPAAIGLEGKPVISINDIVSYNQETHEIEVKPAAFERVKNLEVPVRGRTFAVCIGREAIYTGAFWTPISSISFDGIIIMKPILKNNILQLEPGYPSNGFFKGDDPRSNSRIMDSLQRAGKLK
jgi:hypothetical protein